ncbi:MAG: cyclic nucleotide-binding domain-containing protein [Hyphomicrobiales bacterium]|nr:MAG: cyclic nucleotide-binding domain-containing protein [Hyphomicrobiales bacterium]
MHIQSNFRGTALAGMPPAGVTFHAADTMIYAQGDAAGTLYQVEFGTIRICRMTADGRRQITGFLTAGDVFGFEAGAEHNSSAESVDGAGIRLLRPASPAETTTALLQSLARTQHLLMLLGCRSANVRMGTFILDLSERQADGRLVHLAMQRNDIADYLGMTFETVSRALRHLKDEGLIRLNSITEIEILNRPALEALCE